jgi:hypothetical protein
MTVLDALAVRDFVQLAECFAPSVQGRALLPPGHRDYDGADALVTAFRTWFGTASVFELVDSAVGEVAGREHLRWRFRGVREGSPEVIEQQAYVDRGSDGRILRLDLLCSGFRPE